MQVPVTNDAVGGRARRSHLLRRGSIREAVRPRALATPGPGQVSDGWEFLTADTAAGIAVDGLERASTSISSPRASGGHNMNVIAKRRVRTVRELQPRC